MDPQILIVEDNDDDVLMIQRGLKKGKIGNSYHRVTNGKEGLDYLQSHDAKNIQVILLDLNMEVMNGFEFLQKRMDFPEIKKIPIVVLTSSSRQEDIEKSYELGANSYVEKPLEPSDFIQAICKIEDFWIYLSRRP